MLHLVLSVTFSGMKLPSRSQLPVLIQKYHPRMLLYCPVYLHHLLTVNPGRAPPTSPTPPIRCTLPGTPPSPQTPPAIPPTTSTNLEQDLLSVSASNHNLPNPISMDI